jgi:hypothetical protein
MNRIVAVSSSTRIKCKKAPYKPLRVPASRLELASAALH